jgi:hypothetical protein
MIRLRRFRHLYETGGVFPKLLIDKTIDKLTAYADKNLWADLLENPEKAEDLLTHYLHYG